MINPPLDDEAARNLYAVSRFMTKADYIPELILSSRTQRASDMVDLIRAQLSCEPASWSESAIHYAAVGEMIESIRTVKGSIRTILVICNARRIAHLALKLTRGYGPYAARAARHRMLTDFPVGAFAALSLAVESWSDLVPKAGLVRSFIMPSDLRPRDH